MPIRKGGKRTWKEEEERGGGKRRWKEEVERGGGKRRRKEAEERGKIIPLRSRGVHTN
jgi:hypothetical protein